MSQGCGCENCKAEEQIRKLLLELRGQGGKQ